MAEFKKAFEFAKTSPARQEVSGIVYPVLKIDKQNEYAGPEALKKAAHKMAQVKGFPYRVDIQHDTKITKSKIVETWVAPEDGSYYSKGDWLATIKVDDSTWKRVESGELRAFSMYGSAGGRKRTYNGETVRELVSIKPSLISLVARGANAETFMVKADDGGLLKFKEQAPAWFKKWAPDFLQKVTDLHTRLDRIAKQKPRLRRSGKKRVRRIAEVARPKRKIGNKNNRASVKPKKTDAEKASPLNRLNLIFGGRRGPSI